VVVEPAVSRSVHAGSLVHRNPMFTVDTSRHLEWNIRGHTALARPPMATAEFWP